MTFQFEMSPKYQLTNKMLKVTVKDMLKMMKMGLDDKFLDFFVMDDNEYEDVMENIRDISTEDKLFMIEKSKTLFFTYEELLFDTLCYSYVAAQRRTQSVRLRRRRIYKNPEHEHINTIFKHCNEKYVQESLKYCDPDVILNFYKATKRWDLCRDAVMCSTRPDNPELHKVFRDHLVVEKDCDMKDESVLFPYIRSTIDSLVSLPTEANGLSTSLKGDVRMVSLPVYVIYKIVSETYHTHKYFEEWQIISMIQMAKGEDTIYINHPEYEECFDFSGLTLEEQRKICDTLLNRFKYWSQPYRYDAEKRKRYAMEVCWILYTTRKLLDEKTLRMLYKKIQLPPSLHNLEKLYMKTFGTWIEGSILSAYKNDFLD